MNCRKCNKPIEPDSRFCKHCGARIRRAADAPAAKKPARPAAPDAAAGDIHRDPQHEQFVWAGRPAWRAFAGAWLVWFLLSALCLYLASKYATDVALVRVVWLFVGGGAVALLVREALIVYGLSYHLTTQRLFVHKGILTRTTDQLELLRIDDVRISQGVIDRLVDTGSLEVFSSDETDETVKLQSIPAPAAIAEELRRHVRGVRSKGTLAVERV
jgi:membrane protein YdbS with pleckstrin-like domain